MTIPFRSFVPNTFKIGQESRPRVTDEHYSSRDGVFICGDLAGHPTLKTSIRDGYQTIRSAEKWLNRKNLIGLNDYDVVICGAGASGIAAAFEAKKLNLNYLVLEKNRPANTIVNFSEGKKILARQELLELDTRALA